jgi:hypothetical protein
LTKSSSQDSTSNPPSVLDDRSGNTTGVVGLAIFAVAVLSQLASFDRSIVPMDEGHLAALAMGLQDGKLLYRDLHTGIFPGIYHLTALLFNVFGNDLIVTRYAEVATNGAIAVCLWLAGARMMLRGWALAPPLLYIAVVPISFPVLAMFNYSSLALALAMTSFYLLLRYLEDGSRNVAIALGASLALTVFCKQNFGAFTFAALLLGLLANRRDSTLAAQSWPTILLPVAAAGLAVTLGVATYFIFTGTLGDFVQSTVIQIGGDQMESFNNPIPPILGSHPQGDGRFTFLYSPPYVFNKLIHGEAILGNPVNAALQGAAIRLSYGIPVAALLLAPAVWFFGVRSKDAAKRRGVRAGVIFAPMFFLGIFPSAVWSHLAFVLPPVFLLIGLAAAGFDDALHARSAPAARAFRAVAATSVGCLLAIAVLASMDVARWNNTSLDLPRASLHVTPGQAQLYPQAVAFAQNCASPDEAIFVAPYMPIVYFLSDRPNASRYDLTIPGNVDGSRIIESLDAAGTRCVVYNPVMYPEFEPFAVLFPNVSDYLQRQYRPTRKLQGGGEAWLGMKRREP